MASANAPAKSCSLTCQDDRSEVKPSTGRSSERRRNDRSSGLTGLISITRPRRRGDRIVRILLRCRGQILARRDQFHIRTRQSIFAPARCQTTRERFFLVALKKKDQACVLNDAGRPARYADSTLKRTITASSTWPRRHSAHSYLPQKHAQREYPPSCPPFKLSSVARRERDHALFACRLIQARPPTAPSLP